MSKKANATKTASLAIDAEMTVYHAVENKQRFLDALAAAEVLEIDLSRVGEVDTAGIQLLILLKRESQRLGREVRIVAHSPAVQELIDFYNIAGFLGDPLVIPAQAG